MNNVSYICSDCAREEQAKWPKDHLATWHNNFCDLCKKNKDVCSPRNWKWPRNHPLTLNRE